MAMSKYSGFAVLCLLSLIAGGTVDASLDREIVPALVTQLDDSRPLDDGVSEAAVRSRRVGLDLDVLRRLDLVEAPRIEVELFENKRIVAHFDDLQVPRPGSRVWIGKIEDDPLSWVLLSTHGGAALLYVRSPLHGQHEIVPSSGWDGGWILSEIDPLGYAPCATFDESHEAESGWSPAIEAEPPVSPTSGGTCVDDGDTIDVLVVYTGRAARVNGGPDGMEALAAAAIASTNDAYSRSLITPRLRLVDVRKVQYFESSYSGVDLTRLETPGDGYMDEVQPLRDAVAADVVSLIVDQLIGACGQARFSIEFGGITHPEKAYNVVRDNCAVGTLTFAHEIGHNQGSRHDRDHDNTPGAYEYSHGYATSNFETVMSIIQAFPLVPHFSNPDVFYGTEATGVPTWDPYSAHNAQSINQTASAVANFRCCENVDASGQCIVPSCPPTYDCGGPDCTEQIPSQCYTTSFGGTSCMSSGGDLQLCPGGVVMRRCVCQTNTPGEICLNENQTMQCLP